MVGVSVYNELGVYESDRRQSPQSTLYVPTERGCDGCWGRARVHGCSMVAGQLPDCVRVDPQLGEET